MNVRVLFLMLSIIFEVIGGEKKISVTSFDVAQGNGGLVVCYDPEENISPWLVDAGCNFLKATKGKAYTKKEIVSEIVAAIDAACTATGTDDFYITVSHPDIDHYNLIPDIVSECMKKGRVPKKIVLGGIEELYGADFREFLNEQRDLLRKAGAEEEEVEEFIQFPTQDGNTTNIIELAVGKNLRYEILPALQATTVPEKNAGSLVVRAVYGTPSFTFSGDATGETEQHIMEHEPDLTTTAISLGHHGASTEESNSLPWLQQLQPQLVVASSGKSRGYRHPQNLIVNRVSGELPVHKGSYRAVFAGSNTKDVEDASFKGFSSKTSYGFQVTNKPVYGTLDRGSLTFEWGLDDKAIRFVPTAHQQEYRDQKSCILATLTKVPRSNVVSPENLTFLNLSNLGIDDSKPRDLGFLTNLFMVLTEKSTRVLKKLFLHGNAIHLSGTIVTLLIPFLTKSGKVLELLNMTQNQGLQEVEKKLLKESALCTVLV